MGSREMERKSWSRIKLVRKADGSLAPATGRPNIGDIWAEQRRIQLHDAIKQDENKAARKKLRDERGLVGAIKTILFGQNQPDNTTPAQTRATKEVEITVNLPKIKLPDLRKIRHLPKKAYLATAVAFIIPIAAISALHIKPPHNSQPVHQAISAAAKITAGPIQGKPSYHTLLPVDKTIESLGGWYRVSPPDRNPVYAFADKINGTAIDVSEQPLPVDFQTDTASQLAQLATSFNANEKLTVGTTTVYIGTSAKGPQSLILIKDNVLILIKSVSKLSNDQWAAYVNSLQ